MSLQGASIEGRLKRKWFKTDQSFERRRKFKHLRCFRKIIETINSKFFWSFVGKREFISRKIEWSTLRADGRFYLKKSLFAFVVKREDIVTGPISIFLRNPSD